MSVMAVRPRRPYRIHRGAERGAKERRDAEERRRDSRERETRGSSILTAISGAWYTRVQRDFSVMTVPGAMHEAGMLNARRDVPGNARSLVRSLARSVPCMSSSRRTRACIPPIKTSRRFARRMPPSFGDPPTSRDVARRIVESADRPITN